MTSLNKKNILRGLIEIVIVVIGVTIAFWVEQYREDINNKRQLKNALIDIDKSLMEDSIQITTFNYGEIRIIIEKIDSSIILLESRITLDLRRQPNFSTQPLMDFSNNNLDTFITSESFNDLENVDLKSEMLSYRRFTNGEWRNRSV